MQAHFPEQRLVIEPNRDRSFSLDRDLYVSHFPFLMSGIWVWGSFAASKA